MGLKDGQGEIHYIIGLLKSIRQKLGKSDGDVVHVVIVEQENPTATP